MKNSFYIVDKKECDLSKLTEVEKNDLKIVSFKISVLDKYRNNADYFIELNNNVGFLKSNKEGWILQVDINSDSQYLTTFLYKLGEIPNLEQEHFADYNIYPRELSPSARKLWGMGGI